MTVSAYVVWFCLASIIGWLFETIYAILRTGRWERRGFLFGPACPIYGVGVVAGLLLFNRPVVASGEFPAWGVFLVSACGSAVLEYLVSVVFERLFGVLWWDYSDMPLNLNGRICLPASLLFGAAGLFVAYILAPFLNNVAAQVPAAVFEVAALGLVAFLASDTTATVINLSDLMEKIVKLDESANDKASSLTDQTVSAVRAVPTAMGNGVRKAVGQVKQGKAEAAARIGSARDAAAQKIEEASAARQEMVARTADALTKRQARMLAQLRRFRSDEVRQKAEILLSMMSGLPEGKADEEEGARSDE